MAAEIESWQNASTSGSDDQHARSAMYSLMQDALTTQANNQDAVLGQQPSEPEHRHNTRRKFTCIQLVAPYEGRRMPSQAEFQPQLCHDLSPTGFSFWQQKPLAVSHLIVALGEVPFLFFVAEIVHQAYKPHSEPGGWRIGCRFIRRVER